MKMKVDGVEQRWNEIQIQREHWRLVKERMTKHFQINTAKEIATTTTGTRNKKEEDFRVKYVTWNMAGVNKIKHNWEFLGQFHIILGQETWLQEAKEREVIEKLNKNDKWITKPAGREKKKGKGNYCGYQEKFERRSYF